MNTATALVDMPAAPVEAKPAKGSERKATVGTKSDGSKGSRRPAQKSKAASRARYFLAAKAENGSIGVGKELPSESEAVVEAFREQTSFFVVTEWRVAVQLTGAAPQLVKEGVARAEKA